MEYNKIAQIIKESKYPIAFTGAGISVESGIPPFRGEGGLWRKYDPNTLDISNFEINTAQAWSVIKEIFYDHWNQAAPNAAHIALAEMEKMGLLKGIITMNIDALHQKAGSKNVVEYHGTLNSMICMKCRKIYNTQNVDLATLPPRCKCGGILKPNFIFFGEGIPTAANIQSNQMAEKADLVIVVGTTGTVTPACYIPNIAHQHGAKIVEINPSESTYTHTITTHYIKEKAGIALSELQAKLMDN